MTCPFRRILGLMIREREIEVIEDVIGVRFTEHVADHARVLLFPLGRYVTSDGETHCAVFVSSFGFVTPRNRHVVHDPMMLIVEENSLSKKVQLDLVVFDLGRVIFFWCKRVYRFLSDRK